MPLVISSEQEPSRLIVFGLDDASGQQHGLAQQRLDVLSLDAVLPALDPVAGIPIEILRMPSKASSQAAVSGSPTRRIAIV